MVRLLGPGPALDDLEGAAVRWLAILSVLFVCAGDVGVLGEEPGGGRVGDYAWGGFEEDASGDGVAEEFADLGPGDARDGG